jgi:DNA-binding transcriptional MerR regulator
MAKGADMHRITEAARQLGVHPDTLRNLERRGLIRVQRDWNGARRFTPPTWIACARCCSRRRARRTGTRLMRSIEGAHRFEVRCS